MAGGLLTPARVAMRRLAHSGAWGHAPYNRQFGVRSLQQRPHNGIRREQSAGRGIRNTKPIVKGNHFGNDQWAAIPKTF
jgi:hypothetical protein